MSQYAIGDIQGCHEELLRLMDHLNFDPHKDQLWFTGDLVNRGPHSLETLRTIRSLGDAAVCVLGNHDLHLLAVAKGISRTKHQDTFANVLNAPDCDELLDWLRTRPLLHHEAGFYLIHAGFPPQWTLNDAEQLAKEVETILRSPDHMDFLWHMYGNEPDLWREDLEGFDRLRFITNCLTRLRFVTPDGRLNLSEKGSPQGKADALIPWFAHPERRSMAGVVIYGHWSTLGFHRSHHTLCIDTGCLWGGSLTAVRLDESLERFSVNNNNGPYQRPESSR
jgi:bis(5'-nucleosyl)-tetraphosphatase (symmetrical)